MIQGLGLLEDACLLLLPDRIGDLRVRRLEGCDGERHDVQSERGLARGTLLHQVRADLLGGEIFDAVAVRYRT